jgi:cytochrome c551/c552
MRPCLVSKRRVGPPQIAALSRSFALTWIKADSRTTVKDERAMYKIILFAIVAVTAVSGHAQDGDAVAGHAFAREACRACHMVEAEQPAPRIIVIGPAFRDIANTRGMTATALRVFLTTSHPKMPNLILTPEETADVIAYILSLRSPPP